MTTKPQSLDEILHHLGNRVTLSPVIGGAEVDYAEAKQAVLRWVDEVVIGDAEPDIGITFTGRRELIVDADTRNQLRGRQRAILKAEGYKR